MGDVERALLSKAIEGGAFHHLISRGIHPGLFSATETGQQCARVFEYAASYSRSYAQPPSLGAIQRQFPDWHGEFSPDPLEALADEFLALVRKRYFEAAVLELSTVTNDRSTWNRLDEIILDAARDVAAAVPAGSVSRLSQMQERIERYEREQEDGRAPGIALGIPIIDEITLGVRPGKVITNAGWSGLGKSMLTTWNLLNAVEQDKVALMISLEMTSEELFERIDTMIMHFSNRALQQRSLNPALVDHWKRVSRVYSKCKGDLIVVDRLDNPTVDRVYAEIARYKPDISAVDYVQRMRAPHGSKSKRWEVLDDLTNELKSIALATDSAIIMVSQDGRGAAQEGSTETNMGGHVSVYQAADLYLGLFQDPQMKAQRKMRIRMLKNRGGPIAEVDMLWDPDLMLFQKWEDTDAFQKQAISI